MKNKKLISVVIPCFNEQDVLKLYYDEMKKVMERISEVDFELIFVDDGSRDKTLEILKEFHKIDKRCRYVSLSRNFGKESAMYAGFIRSHGDYVVVMDVDLQDPPSYIPRMYNIIKNGECDCVATRRCNRKGEKRIRSFLSAKFYKVINKISEIEVPDGLRDYRMMSRKMVNAVLEMSEYNRFSKGLFSWVGFKTEWIEYHNTVRAAGETKWSLRQLFRYSFDGIIGFSTCPLLLALYIGVFLGIVDLATFAGFEIYATASSTAVAIWKYILCGALLLESMQFICIGFLGQYIGRINSEVKHRPIYIIDETSEENNESNKSKNKKNKNNIYAFSNGYTNDSRNVSTVERVSPWYKE